MRDLIEARFEVAMARDAIAAGCNDEDDAYQAALADYRFMTHAVWTIDETIERMKAAAR